MVTSGTSTVPISFVTAPGATVTVSGQANGVLISGKSWIAVRGSVSRISRLTASFVASSAHITVSPNRIEVGHPSRERRRLGGREQLRRDWAARNRGGSQMDEPSTGDFRLNSGSPAIDSATWARADNRPPRWRTTRASTIPRRPTRGSELARTTTAARTSPRPVRPGRRGRGQSVLRNRSAGSPRTPRRRPTAMRSRSSATHLISATVRRPSARSQSTRTRVQARSP